MNGVKVRVFSYYRELFGASDINAELPDGGTIRDLLEKLCDTPERNREIFAGRQLRSHVVVMVNGRPIDPCRGLEEPLRAGDAMALFPFIGGG